MRYEASSVTVSAPAAVENLGSGAGTFGLALDMRDTMVVEALAEPQVKVAVIGEGFRELPIDESNLVVRSFRAAQEELGLPLSGVRLESHNRILQSKGLGSSIAAVVAGVGAAVAMGTGHLVFSDSDRDFIFDFSTKIIESSKALQLSPSIAAMVYGKLRASWGSSVFSASATGFHSVGYSVSPLLSAYLMVPRARQSASASAVSNALPARLPYADAVRGISSAAILPGVLAGIRGAKFSNMDAQAANECLLAATDSTMQNYLRELAPDAWQLMKLLRSQGYAAVVAGNGPCVVVLRYSSVSSTASSASAATTSTKASAAKETLKEIAQVVDKDYLRTERWRLLEVPIARDGVRIEKNENNRGWK
jgi:homoserine kinase